MIKSLATKLAHLRIKLQAEKISDTHEFSEWETGFLTSVLEQAEVRGERSLSEKQTDRIHVIYDKYFDA